MIMRLSQIEGLDVFTDDGRHIGELADITINPENGNVVEIAVVNLEEDFKKELDIEKSGVLIPYKAVKSIKDIVVLKNVKFIVKPQ